MSNPSMPSLYGQIFETLKANYKMIMVFALLITIAETLCGGTFMQFLDVAEKTGEFSIPTFLLLSAIWSYIYPQIQIIAMDYHQQPPNQPRTPLWIMDKGFNKDYLRFCLHMFYIMLLTLAVLLFLGCIILIGLLTGIPLIIIIGGLLTFVAVIALIPLTATKLPAVLDPNGDTSLKAAFARGKHIFWRYLGNSAVIGGAFAVTMAITLIALSVILMKIGFLPNTLTMETILIAQNIGTTSFFLLNIVQNIFTMISLTIFGVIASHYYIWSEYYLPSENSQNKI